MKNNIKRLSIESNYLREYLIDCYNITESALILAEKIMNNNNWNQTKYFRSQYIAERNFFYLDAIKFFLKDAIDYIESLDFSIELPQKEKQKEIEQTAQIISIYEDIDIFVNSQDNLKDIYKIKNKFKIIDNNET